MNKSTRQFSNKKKKSVISQLLGANLITIVRRKSYHNCIITIYRSQLLGANLTTIV